MSLSLCMFLLSCLYLLTHVWFIYLVYIYLFIIFLFFFFFFSVYFPFLISFFVFHFNLFIYFLIYFLLFTYLFLSLLFTTWNCHIIFIVMKLVFPTWICLIRFVLEVSVYCIMWKSTVAVVRILTVTIGIIPSSSLFHGDIGRDGGMSFNFYIYFCVCRIWSVKDLVIYFIEKILLFVAPGLAFLNRFPLILEFNYEHISIDIGL